MALEHVHQKKVVFRDLKPENVLIDADGHAKLTDFGLAKEICSCNTKAHSFCGSPAYISPEMLGNEGVTQQSDIY